MDKLNYKRRPALVSFALRLLICLVLAFFLVLYSPEISHEVFSQIAGYVRLPEYITNLQIGVVLAFPLILYMLHQALWVLMSQYKIDNDEIRLILGSVKRVVNFHRLASVREVNYRQSIIETPFGIGTLIIQFRNGQWLEIRGVHDIEENAEHLRSVAKAQSAMSAQSPSPVQPDSGNIFRSNPEYNPSRPVPNRVEIQRVETGRSGNSCSNCLIIMIIIILLPIVLGIIFKIALIGAIITAITKFIHQFL